LLLDETLFFECRSQVIDAFLRAYDADIEIVNHNPRGLNADFMESTKNRSKTTRILSLHGVVYDCEATYQSYFRPERADYILKNYDKIVLHTDQEIFDFNEYYAVPQQMKELVTYSGYLSERYALNKEQARAVLGYPLDERIIICSMAGGQGSISIINNFLRNVEKLRSEFDRCILLPGPYLEKSDFEGLCLHVAGDAWIEVHRYVSEMRNWMTAADVFVGAAGSSMISEVLSTGIHALLIARQRFEAEQEIHATFIQERGLISKLSLDAAESEDYSDLILDCREKSRQRRHSVRMDGARTYCRIVKELAARKEKA
jgi:predicted glycosyltransferase